MQSEKVLTMPAQTSNRPPRLRHDENPPYPEHDIQILREVLKINEGVGETKRVVQTFESELKNQGERLRTATRTLDKHAEKLDGIEGSVSSIKKILWFLAVLSALLVTAVAVFEIYKSMP